MYYVVMKDRDIRDNLATEQYLMNNVKFDEPLVLFYIEKPCIIVGRNQNTIEEINSDYIKDNNITVTRRISGGGAVYQDLGNLCFSFMVDSDDKNFGDFKSFTQPIIDALHKMGATTAEVSGRNDLLVDGKKFSGNAMYSRNGKTFSHGTLSLDVDLDVLTKALHVQKDKIASKGIKSIRSRVTNLRPYLAPEFQDLDTEGFRDKLLLELFHANNLDEIKEHEYVVSAAEQKEIDKIKEQYYYNWDWVYGKSPAFTAKQRKHFDMGTVDVRYNIENGKVENIEIYGDFFGMKDVNDIKQKLLNIKFDRDEILNVLKQFNLDDYFKGIPEEDLGKLFTP